ncbi:MAG: retropepsin-like domain-containing protein [Armatimonadota bacterium]|nr:retropepsin-like domain-containing protein [Armatimonadota bacterium]
MNFAFDPTGRLIIISAELFGPFGCAVVTLALDTGATVTMINRPIIEQLGYDVARAPDYRRVTTGSRVETVPFLMIDQIEPLGCTRYSLPVVCHTLPSTFSIDGLLGLNFLREQQLLIDFRTGLISLN